MSRGIEKITFSSISIIVLLLWSLTSFPVDRAFADKPSGSVEFTVVHADGSNVDYNDFVAGPWDEAPGYYSLNRDSGELVDTFPSCNLSMTSCEVHGLEAGKYSASITLDGLSVSVGGHSSEYSTSFSVSEGKVSDVVLYVDFGYLEVNAIHHYSNSLLEGDEFSSANSLVEGYYSLYDDEGNYVLDAASCNLESSCRLPVNSGIYEARVSSAEGLTDFEQPFEIQDNQLTQVEISVDQGSFKVTVVGTEDSSIPVKPSLYYSPRGSHEGSFTLYDAEGSMILNGKTCNMVDSCSYSYYSGTYIVSIRLNASSFDSCAFDIADDSVTDVLLYLDTLDCNFEALNLPSNPGSPTPGTDQGPNPSKPANQPPNPIIKPTLGSQIRTVAVTNSSHYIDHDGIFHLVGEVQNTQVIPAQNVVVTGVFYSNATKDVLAVKRGHSFIETLSPGEKSPFEITVKDAGAAQNIGSYTLNAIFSNVTSKAKPGQLELILRDNAYSNDTRTYHIDGKVFNHGDSSAHFVRVSVSFYDQNQTIIYIAQKYIASQIPSSSISEFELDFRPIDASKISSVSAMVQSEEYAMIPAGSKMLASPIQLTLDSPTYDNGGIIKINGTIGIAVPWERYALVYILWPDGDYFDKELALVSDDGTYYDEVAFYSSEEHLGKTFTVRVIYNNSFSETNFVFSK